MAKTRKVRVCIALSVLHGFLRLPPDVTILRVDEDARIQGHIFLTLVGGDDFPMTRNGDEVPPGSITTDTTREFADIRW